MNNIALIITVALAFAGSLLPNAFGSDDAYPLTTCVVSGEPLDAMGGPYVFDYEGRTVKFCCEHCKPDFLKAPEKYLAKLDQAESGRSEQKDDASRPASGHPHDNGKQ